MTTPNPCNCPNCGRRVVQLGQDGAVKVRTPLILFKAGSAKATVICRHCHEEVDVEIIMGSGLIKSVKRPRIIMRRPKER